MNTNIARIIFVVGLGAAAVAAVVIGLDGPAEGMTEDRISTDDFDLMIDLAFSDYEANNARADSAPQQQVVNGWIAKDLLGIVVLQNEATADTLDAIANLQTPAQADDRAARLLVVLTVAIAWIGAWAALAWRPRHITPSDPRSSSLLEAE